MHYAIVLSNSSKTNPNLIVIPLKSHKENRTIKAKTELYLGTELYNRLVGKKTGLELSLAQELNNLNDEQTKLVEQEKELQEILASEDIKDVLKFQKLLTQIAEKNRLIEKRKADVQKQVEVLRLVWKELSKMNHGSIALITQIKTISKMRVMNPCSKNDVLYGIKLSSDSLDSIDQKILSIWSIEKVNSTLQN